MLVALLALEAAAEPQLPFAESLADQPGWLDLRWGDAPPADLRLDDAFHGVAIYVRPDGTDRIVGPIAVERVEYTFLDGAFQKVALAADRTAADAIVAALTELYGEPARKPLARSEPARELGWNQNQVDVRVRYAGAADAVVEVSNRAVGWEWRNARRDARVLGLDPPP
jgi:hypothetical protein